MANRRKSKDNKEDPRSKNVMAVDICIGAKF